MERLKSILTYGLLAFTLISIGFALGKNAAKSEQQADGQSTVRENGTYVAVYYLHSTYRCTTCNTIEKMTRELLENAYSQPLAEGKMQWFEDDFQKNEALAKQFEVIASCVVVADIKDGVVIEYKRLDDVWTLMADPKAFNQYISQAIDAYLAKTGDQR